MGCLKDPLISGLIQNISFEINWNLFSACQVLVAFPYIYLRSHAGIVLDRGQRASRFLNTLYPRRSSWEIDISPSRVVTDIKNQNSCSAEQCNSRLISIGVPPRCRLGLITRSNLHSSLCFRRVVCWFSYTQLFLSLGAGVLKEVVSSALSAAAQDVLLQL